MTRCDVSGAVNHHALKKNLLCLWFFSLLNGTIWCTKLSLFSFGCAPLTLPKKKQEDGNSTCWALVSSCSPLDGDCGGVNLSYPCFWAPSWQRQCGSRQIPQLRYCCRLVCHPRWFLWTRRTGRSLDKSDLQAHSWDMDKVYRAQLLTPQCQSPGSSGEKPVKKKNLTGGLQTRLHSKKWWFKRKLIQKYFRA